MSRQYQAIQRRSTYTHYDHRTVIPSRLLGIVYQYSLHFNHERDPYTSIKTNKDLRAFTVERGSEEYATITTDSKRKRRSVDTHPLPRLRDIKVDCIALTRRNEAFDSSTSRFEQSWFVDASGHVTFIRMAYLWNLGHCLPWSALRSQPEVELDPTISPTYQFRNVMLARLIVLMLGCIIVRDKERERCRQNGDFCKRQATTSRNPRWLHSLSSRTSGRVFPYDKAMKHIIRHDSENIASSWIVGPPLPLDQSVVWGALAWG